MGKTVLIVEDDDLNLKLFDEVLTLEGYRTRTARTGSDALDQARRERPDLVLMDMDLGGSSGLDAVRRMRDEASLDDVPVVAVTAHAMRGDEGRFRDGGCAGYIAKPVTMRGFLDEVRRFA